LNVFRRLSPVVGRPLLNLAGATQISAELAEIDRRLAWKTGVTGRLESARFDELAANIRQAESNLSKLWPREQREFIERLTQRQRVLARADLDGAVISATLQAPNGLEGARARSLRPCARSSSPNGPGLPRRRKGSTACWP
jgi:hypothetical protein